MALQGTLDTFALPDVLRLLASTKKTGRLLVSGSRGTGSVWVDNGGVVGSEATGAAPEAPAPDGAFTFEAGTTTDKPAPSRAVEPLLVDAERLLTEWREIEAVVPSMDAWVSLVPELASDEIAVSAVRWKTIVAVGSGTSVTGIGATLELGEIDVCRQVKDLVELGLAKVSTTPMPTIRPLEESDAAGLNGTAAKWDPFAIEIPGVDAVAAVPAVEAEPEPEPVDEISVVADEVDDDEPLEADEMAKQLASLSPKAARAVAAAAKASTTEERDAALAEVSDEDDEPINRGLLLKFLSSVKS